MAQAQTHMADADAELADGEWREAVRRTCARLIPVQTGHTMGEEGGSDRECGGAVRASKSAKQLPG